MHQNVEIRFLKFSVGGVVWNGIALVPYLITGVPYGNT